MNGAGELVAFLCCDLAGIVRGRSVPASAVEERLTSGVGWVPANQSLTALGTIVEPNPFGSIGDLRLIPDPDSRVRVAPVDERASALELLLCDIRRTDGASWDCCARTLLREAVADLRSETGATLMATFEHEFQIVGDEPAAAPFSLEAQRRAEPFGAELMAALDEAGVEPELFLPEYGPHQFEVPCGPAGAVRAGDRSVIVKEVVREVARRLGRRATFTPLTHPDAVGNGAHLHFDLRDDAGHGLLHDPARAAGLSELGGGFAAGVLRHAAALLAFLAPSPVSATRLRPHRWSAAAACVGLHHRETFLRLPSVASVGGGEPAAQYHLELRAVDATANPYLVLAVLARAGLQGIRERLPAPPVLDTEIDDVEPGDRERFGVGALPTSLGAALDALEADNVARGWLPDRLYSAYSGVKRAELAAAVGLDDEELCRRYADLY